MKNKHLFLLVLILALIPFLVRPTPAARNFAVTLAWDANSEPDIVGYRVYTSLTPGVYTAGPAVTADEARATVTGLAAGQTVYFVVTAFNTSDLESDYSNEVFCALPSHPRLPQSLRIESFQVVAPTP